MNTTPKNDYYAGFEHWWSIVPKHKRKIGKIECSRLWLAMRLWLVKDQIIAAQEDDNRALNRGEFAPANDPSNKYKYYPAATRWLRRAYWSRDWACGGLSAAAKKKPAGGLPDPPPLTRAEKRKIMLANGWRQTPDGRLVLP